MQSLQPRPESEGDGQRLPAGDKSARRAGRGRAMREPPPSSQRRHRRSCWQEGETLLPTLVQDKGGRKWHRESDRHITTDQVEPGRDLPSTTGQVFVLPGDKKLRPRASLTPHNSPVHETLRSCAHGTIDQARYLALVSATAAAATLTSVLAATHTDPV